MVAVSLNPRQEKPGQQQQQQNPGQRTAGRPARRGRAGRAAEPKSLTRLAQSKRILQSTLEYGQIAPAPAGAIYFEGSSHDHSRANQDHDHSREKQLPSNSDSERPARILNGTNAI